jgi:hypothetical protein
MIAENSKSDKNTSHHHDPVQRARSTVHARNEKDSGAALERTGEERELCYFPPNPSDVFEIHTLNFPVNCIKIICTA